MPAGVGYHRRVYKRHRLLQILDEESVEQCLVAVLQSAQIDVLLERVRFRVELGARPRQLIGNATDAVGKEAAQTECVTLFLREGRPLVEERILEQILTTAIDG